MSRRRSTASGPSSPSAPLRSTRPTRGGVDGHATPASRPLRRCLAVRAHRRASRNHAARVAPLPTCPATETPHPSPLATRRHRRLTPSVDAATVARGTLKRVSELAQQPVDGVRIIVDGRAVSSETTLTAAGPSVLTLITALGALGLTVTSTYV